MAVENRSGELLTPTSLGGQSPLPIKQSSSLRTWIKRCLRDSYGVAQESMLGSRNPVIKILKRLSAKPSGKVGFLTYCDDGFIRDRSSCHIRSILTQKNCSCCFQANRFLARSWMQVFPLARWSWVTRSSFSLNQSFRHTGAMGVEANSILPRPLHE